MAENGSDSLHLRLPKQANFQSGRVFGDDTLPEHQLGSQFGGAQESVLRQRQIKNMAAAINPKTAGPCRKRLAEQSLVKHRQTARQQQTPARYVSHQSVPVIG